MPTAPRRWPAFVEVLKSIPLDRVHGTDAHEELKRHRVDGATWNLPGATRGEALGRLYQPRR